MSEQDNLFGVEPTLDSGQFEQEETQEETQTEQQEEQTEETPVEEETSSPEQGQDEEQEPILGKFKTQEDLVNAYKNLEREFTRLRQQSKETPKQEQSPQQQQTINEDEQMMSWFNDMVQQDPYKAVMGLSQYMAKREVEKVNQQYEPLIQERTTQQQLNATANKFKDFYDYQQEISNELDLMSEEEPELLKEPKAFEIAYFRAKSKALEEKAKTAFENGKKSALENRKSKQQVNNEQSNSNQEEDTLPEGINIIPGGDGIFI